MANCKYYLRGYEFKSPLELDDFLLSKYKYLKSMGDAVFAYSERKLQTIEKLKEIRKNVGELRRIKAESKISYSEDGEEHQEYKRPYVGVNAFLSGLQIEGKRLFPEFIEENFWDSKKAKWAKGEFDKSEIEMFFDGDESKITPIKDENIFLQYKQRIKTKWKKQGITGSFLHKAFEIYFNGTRQSGSELNLEEVKSELRKWYDIEYKNPNKEVDNGQFEDYIDEEKLVEMLKHAKNLKQELISRLGYGCSFFTEFAISGKSSINVEGKGDTLLGYIDLLVIDRHGTPHIVDYKASVKPFTEFNEAKQLTYKYQLATYHRILQAYGINTKHSKLFISPFKMNDFKVEDNGDFSYSGISQASQNEILIDYTDEILDPSRPYQEKLDEFLPIKKETSLTSEELVVKTVDFMKSVNPEYSDKKDLTLEETAEELRDNDAVTEKDGKFYYTPPFSNMNIIEADSEEELFEKVFKLRQKIEQKEVRIYDEVIKNLKRAMKNDTDNVSFPDAYNSSNPNASSTWFKDRMQHYLNSDHEVIENDKLKYFGIVAIRNKHNKKIDFIKLSTKRLTYISNKTFKDNGLQRSLGITDAQENSKQNSLMLKATNGNIEFMEMMTVINQIPELFDESYLGEMHVTNPVFNKGLPASNEEIVYSWTQFAKRKEGFENNFANGKIPVLSKFEIMFSTFTEIMHSDKTEKQSRKKFRVLKDSYSELDEILDSGISEKIKRLEAFIKELESKFHQDLDPSTNDQVKIFSDIRRLYSQSLIALADLKGYKFRQQVTESDKVAQSVAIHKDGLQGTYIDNPGQSQSDTLNLVAKLVTQAYQNVRTEVHGFKPQVLKHVNKLKERNSYTLAEDYIVGNVSKIYDNLYEDPEKFGGDIVFKSINDPSLNDAEREILKFALESINNDRNGNMTQEMHESKQKNHDLAYHRVPIVIGGSESEFNDKGMFRMLKDKLSLIRPKKFFERTQKKLQGAFSNPFEEVANSDIFQMTDHFAKTEGPDRVKKIQELRNNGYSFEKNLEVLLLKHKFNKSMVTNVNEVFPTIKTAMVFLNLHGAEQNTKFTSDIEYLTDYIKSSIRNESIVDPKYRGIKSITDQIKYVASAFALGFSPVSFLYQGIQGLWTDIGLMIKKPDGSDSFKFTHFRQALTQVYKDAFHYGNKPTLTEAINFEYALNDMDMNVYAERLSTPKRGIFNIGDFLFRFASRPDFYNRMGILTAQMIKDGSYEAHTLGENGELIYDWTKDKRFELFAKNPTSNSNDPEFNKQKALYITMMQQFIKEGYKDKDGNPLVLDMKNPQPIPRAYTNIQMEDKKSLSDTLYGYYSHEKKSLMHATLLGSMFMQFRTFWSGKKNQYLGSGGIKIRGSFQPVEGMFYKINEDGSISDEYTTEDTGVPVMQWDGEWQEGVLLSIMKTIQWTSLSKTKENFIENWYNEDEKLRAAYRHNVKLVSYDAFMMLISGPLIAAILGGWLEGLEDDSDKEDINDAVKLSATNIVVRSVNNSFLDFNFVTNIFSPAIDWQPFGLSWAAGTTKRFVDAAFGDPDMYDALVKSSAATKATKPIFDVIKPDFFKDEKE